jgi:RNA polymerase sigma factor (sigma-70 family)
MTDDRLLGLYIDRGDEAAFEALVARHAPRVLGVCRQVLRRPHDVEDVFQSTFLLLARNAASILKRESLGHWLHGVAHRQAVRCKVKATRRRAVEGERQGVAMAAEQPDDDIDRRDLRRVIHEEVDRLPERLRRPILLCYLEGLTNDAAARHLGCPSGTLKVRLAKAREILHGRLARRGIALSAALFLLMLPPTAPAADVPRRLVKSTVMAVMATRGRRRIPVVEAPSPGLSPGRLPLVALATVATGAVATAVLYLSSSDRGGFLTWILGAVRRACH